MEINIVCDSCDSTNISLDVLEIVLSVERGVWLKYHDIGCLVGRCFDCGHNELKLMIF